MTGDPWDGRSLEWATPSPPPPFNFAVLPNVEGEEPYWEIKRRAIETQQFAPSRTTSRSKCRATARPASSPRSLPPSSGFALIWHIWWLVGVGIVARLCRVRRVRLARRRGIRDSGRGGGAHRSRPPQRPRGLAAGTRAGESRHERDRRRRGRPRPACRSLSARPRRSRRPRRRAWRRRPRPRSCDRTRRRRSGVQARDRRLRLLDFPAQRHRDVLRLFAAHAVLQTATAGGPSGRELFNPTSIAIETACLLASSFTCGLSAGGGRRAQQLWTQLSLAVTGLLGLRFCCWRRTISPAWSPRRRPAAQRVSVVVLRRGRLPRAARHGGAAVARHDDGAGLRQGLPARTSCAGCCASTCSGTHSTSSGSRCSRSSI